MPPQDPELFSCSRVLVILLGAARGLTTMYHSWESRDPRVDVSFSRAYSSFFRVSSEARNGR
jgi:hypothetical protein